MNLPDYKGKIPRLLKINGSFFDGGILHFEETDSTNIVAEKFSPKINGNFVVSSLRQTGGEGRFKRPWISGFGQGLWFSLFIRNEIPLSRMHLLNFALSLSVAGQIKTFLGEKNRDEVKLKWPNDILLNGKKVCGIILKTGMRGDKPNGVIAGIGLNLNQKPEDFPADLRDKAASLFQYAGKRFEIIPSLIKTVEQLDGDLVSWFDSDFDGVLDKWLSLSIPVGSPISVSDAFGSKREGFFMGINDKGNMLFKHGEKTEVISSGDVEVF